ncbi:PD-(D/E)XK nuclease superfamily protein [Marinobacter changyiensis]|uniref:PD-(D/E)XK nuclease superfamily protein n=1 Tax=Marinobacter changyiensis TaxID=2604091 RepID=UPI0012644079|nr:PD-(D/E)XK nuclease superfamily protein [Marinobacter changyiensis]
MLKMNFVASVTERDIDFILLEELSVNAEFREWFSLQIFGDSAIKSAVGAWHSVCDTQFGESDIVFIFNAITGRRVAVLIENKIDAPPQPNQGDRYRLRGERGVIEGYWDSFKTCIVAPERYLQSSKNTESYDSDLSYENILDYFQSLATSDERFAYKAKIVGEGIEQNRRGYQAIYSEAMTKFVHDYFLLASREHSHLGMQAPASRPAGSTWIMFSPVDAPKDVVLAHQLTAGFVKVFFRGRADDFRTLEERFLNILPNEASIGLAGKSVAIFRRVPEVNPITASCSEQQEEIEEALLRLSELASIVAVNRP